MIYSMTVFDVLEPGIGAWFHEGLGYKKVKSKLRRFIRKETPIGNSSNKLAEEFIDKTIFNLSDEVVKLRKKNK